MIRLRVQPSGDKLIRISGIDTFLALCLHELPEILAQRDAPAARARLFPSPTAHDKKANDDWHQLIVPELRHLFVAAGETVARDLTALEADPDAAGYFRVTFAAEHITAWMTALNQARLILGELFAITEHDMRATDLDPSDPKLLAVMKIEWLGVLLHYFVELQSDATPRRREAGS